MIKEILNQVCWPQVDFVAGFLKLLSAVYMWQEGSILLMNFAGVLSRENL